tara:strand:+ start:384 stop:560 length:177 start_codon:yes stop_codon:yes gene_type:complete
MANTYRIEEEVTTGWVKVDGTDETDHLTKEKAKETLQKLIESGDYNPNRLRLVVDGQI